MKKLNFELKNLCKHNRDGSFSTQANRLRILMLIADTLYKLGYRNMSAQSLKPKHVTALLDYWHSQGLSVGTIKNRMTVLRWWSEKVGKQNVIAASNDAYGIEHRVYVTNISKAKPLSDDKLSLVTDPYTAMSLRLQEAFGLRREESIKFISRWADIGDRIRIKPSWSKGKKYREIPIHSVHQRTVIEEAKQFCGRGSLIPKSMLYIDQLNRFKSQCAQAGINNVHGLRHKYAQTRYEQLTGWKCPAAGGPTSKQLTPAQKDMDREVRLQISKEMGHEREQITATYLGR